MNHDEDFETPKGPVNVAGKPGAFTMTHDGVETSIPVRHFGHAVAAAHKTLGVPIPPDERHWLER
ncbi:hypothetical protein, partial [Salmonella enterica]|uniref:hypothetical protein n=1 Tax=Salmonella enterica TaxID=28901 RepID=UPI003D276C4C